MGDDGCSRGGGEEVLPLAVDGSLGVVVVTIEGHGVADVAGHVADGPAVGEGYLELVAGRAFGIGVHLYELVGEALAEGEGE